MRLTTHFQLAELIQSATADAQGLSNAPDVDQLANLQRLCEEILEPVRDLLGVPLDITSGFRAPAVNAAIPEVGSHTSQHQLGEAADFVPRGLLLADAFHRIRQSDIPVDQCILESGCLHLSCALAGTEPRRQFLIRHGQPGAWTYEAA